MPPQPAAATTMPETYEEVEKRISEAIAAINSRENLNRNKIAQEFVVPVQRLRSRTCEQRYEDYITEACARSRESLFCSLDKTGMPARPPPYD